MGLEPARASAKTPLSLRLQAPRSKGRNVMIAISMVALACLGGARIAPT
ncbi:MAG: hypothetical protein WBA57_13280 [Elainellaceae cyanobacterium]